MTYRQHWTRTKLGGEWHVCKTSIVGANRSDSVGSTACSSTTLRGLNSCCTGASRRRVDATPTSSDRKQADALEVSTVRPRLREPADTCDSCGSRCSSSSRRSSRGSDATEPAQHPLATCTCRKHKVDHCCGSGHRSAAADSSTGRPPVIPLLQRALRRFQLPRVPLRSPYDQTILNLALPSALALAADPLLSLVDTAYVGRLGPDALAALGINTALFSFAFVVFNFLATATTPMLASALAAGDQQKAGRVVIQASTLAVALGTGVTAALMMGSDQLLLLMGAAPDTHASTFTLAREYLVYRACAAPAALLMTVGQGTFRGLEDMRTPLAVSLGANLLHLGLAPALIYGAHMGVSGAAVATAACETGAALAYTGLLWQRRDVLGLWPLPALSLQEVQADYLPFLHAGGAVLARTFLLLGTKTLASAVATRLGTVSIAAHQVLMQLWLLASMVVDSLAVSGQTLVAVALGRGATREARDISDRLLQMGMALGLGIAFLYAICGPFLPHLFSSDAAVNDQVLALLPLAVSLLPINSLVYVLDGVFVGASDFKFLAGAMVLAAASTLVLLLVVEPLDLGLEGVWTALAVLMVGRLTTLGWRYQAVNGPLPASFSTSRTTDPQVDAGPAFQHLNGVAGVDCADPVVCSREADAAHDEVPGNSVSSQ